MRRIFLNTLLVAAFLAAVGYLVYSLVSDPRGAPPMPSTEGKEQSIVAPRGHVAPNLHLLVFPVGSFGPDKERKEYVSGTMILDVPTLDYRGEVLSLDLGEEIKKGKAEGLDDQQLDQQLVEKMSQLVDMGVVLFNQAQLPGAENRNVSIAGHRDTKGMEFFYLNTLGAGDQIYLEYEGKQYVYLYKKTFITAMNDWAPIAISEKSQITLQSCDPVFAPNGIYNRIFVVGELVDIYDLELEDDPVEQPASVDPGEFGPVPSGELPAGRGEK